MEREQAKVQAGLPGNPMFAQTRDEKDLKATDTVGGLMWFETLGNQYLGNATHEQRLKANELALQQGIVNESRGQLQFTDKDKAKDIWKQVLAQPQQGVRTPGFDPDPNNPGQFIRR